MPPPGSRQSRLQPRLASRLLTHAEAHDLGTVLTECGFVVERHPDKVRAPDVAFVSAERVAAGFLPEDGYPIGAPDLAIEIRSAHDSTSDLEARAEEYLAAGARLVWLFDPYVREVIVRRADGPTHTLGRAETLSGEDVVPGFTLALRDLFS